MEGGLENLLKTLRHLKRTVWKRRWLALAVAWPVAIIAAIVVSTIPERHEASARLYVDTETVLKPLMAGLAYQPDIEQQVRMLARTVISRPNVERLMKTPGLELELDTPAHRERTLNRLMEQIKVTPAGSGSLYAISYRDTNPQRAQKIVEATVSMFVNSGSGGKKQDSAEASRFIDEQIRVYETKLVEAEGRLKDFKVRNFGISGVSNQDYFARMSALADQVNKLTVDLQAAENARDSYRRELAGEEPALPLEALPALQAPVASEIDTRLDAQRRQLDDLLRRYTDEHPDVISARRAIAQLEAQKREEALARSKAQGSSRAPAATSPVYQRIRIALAESEATVASLRSQLAAQRARLAEVRAMAGRVPQVEAELAQLNRDYDIIRKNYDQLVARRESASLGVKLDETSHLADFRLVEPPRVSPGPVFPGQLALGVVVLIVTLAAGLAAPIIADVLHPTFDDPAALRQVSGRPLLGTVSMAMSEAARKLAHIDSMRFAAATVLLVVVQLGWLGWVFWSTRAPV